MRSAIGTVGAWFRWKGTRQRCSSWTVLHAQCTTALSSGFPVSQGNAEALDRRGGKTKHRTISYVLSNTSAKNYLNRIVYVQIRANRRWDVFWDTAWKALRELTISPQTKTRNSSGDEIANVKFLRRHSTWIGQRLRPLNRLPNFY